MRKRHPKSASPIRIVDNPQMGQDSLPPTERKTIQLFQDSFKIQIEMLREWKIENPLEFNQLFAAAIITEKFRWEAGEPKLDKVYAEFNNVYFQSDENTFKNIFIGLAAITDKVELIGQINELTYIFGYFIDNKIISFSAPPQLLLRECFARRNKKVLNAETLRVLLESRAISDKREKRLSAILKKIFD